MYSRTNERRRYNQDCEEDEVESLEKRNYQDDIQMLDGDEIKRFS